MLAIFYTRKGMLKPNKDPSTSFPLCFFLSLIKPLLVEVAARIAGLYCAQILATGFSGLIAAGVFAGLNGVRGIAGWRWYVDFSNTFPSYSMTSHPPFLTKGIREQVIHH